MTDPLPLLTQPATGGLDHVFTPGAFRVGVLNPLFSREGVLDMPGTGLEVVQRGSGANLSVDVRAGRAAIRGDRVAEQGTYVCQSTATENRTVSRPSSGSRAYLIYAQVRDRAAASSDGASDWRIESTFTSGDTPPAVPDSAIPLATFVLTSSSNSVTNGMINDVRPWGTVGTAADTGTWGESGFAPVWAADDGTRPLTWMRNADGRVILSGWVRRRAETTTVRRNEFWSFDRAAGWGKGAPVLPPEIRPTGGMRDTMTITSNGDLHLALFPNGAMSYRFQYDTTLVAGANQTWISFDGVTYRANSY